MNLYDDHGICITNERRLHSWDISEFLAAENKCLYDLYATINTASPDSSTSLRDKHCNLLFTIIIITAFLDCNNYHCRYRMYIEQ